VRSYHLHRAVLAALLLADAAALTGSFLAAWWLRFGSGWIAFEPPAPPLGPYLSALPATLLVWMVALNYAGLYQRTAFVVGRADGAKLLAAAAAALAAIFAIGFLYRGFSYSRLVLVLMGSFAVPALYAVRAVLTAVQVALRRRGVGVVRIAILGDGPEARDAAAALARHPDYGFRLAGAIGARALVLPHGLGRVRRLGGPGRIEAILKRARVDEVLLAPPRSVSRAVVMGWAARCARAGVACRMVADVFGILTSRLRLEELFGVPVLALAPSPLERWSNRALKRALDLVLTVPALILLSPLLLAIAAAVRLESPGPALYRQERVGLRGRRFAILKFRSMRQDAERDTGPVWARAGDPRRTRLGRFLRRTSLDELPQLLNVLAGEMSLVGPRPERPFFVKRFARTVPRYEDRHAVRPGVTGWAQINGLRGNTPVEERTKYDLAYIEKWSPWLDLRILFRTAMEVFHHGEAY
jgi:exopolysaccharide biosynthesis polyprenyl glycosylphosphotransferase